MDLLIHDTANAEKKLLEVKEMARAAARTRAYGAPELDDLWDLAGNKGFTAEVRVRVRFRFRFRVRVRVRVRVRSRPPRTRRRGWTRPPRAVSYTHLTLPTKA